MSAEPFVCIEKFANCSTHELCAGVSKCYSSMLRSGCVQMHRGQIKGAL